MTDQAQSDAAAPEAGPSIDEELGAVYDEVTAEPTEEPKAEKPEAEPKEEPEETDAPETAEEETTETEEELPEETPAAETAEEIQAPATWTAESKEKFSTLDPGLQAEILKREKDFAQGIQKNADLAKQAETFNEVVAPYRAMIAAENSTPEQSFAELLKTAYILRTATPQQKGELILGLAQQFGADLSQLNQETSEEEYIDPDIKALQDKLSSIEQKTEQQLQAQEHEQRTALQREIDEFRTKPEHKHFDKVQGVMSALLQTGQAKDLKDAYDQACYANPEIRESIIGEKLKASEAKRIKDEKARAEKAKKAAGVKLSNEDSGVVQLEAGSLDDELAAAYDKATA